MSPIEPTFSSGHTSGPGITRARSGTVTARDMYDGASWDHNYARDRGRAKEKQREKEGEADQSWAELELNGIDGVGGGDKRGSGSGRSESTTGGGGMTMGGNEVGEKLEWKLRWLVMREGTIMILRSRRVCNSTVLSSFLSVSQYR